MFYIADLHTHSHYAKATSPLLNLETMYQWAQVKGIQLVSTGDFTHPGWLIELEQKLEPDGSGFFRLKNPPALPALPGMQTTHLDIRFCLSTEISSVYTYDNKTRKNHNLVYAPDFETCHHLNRQLARFADLSLDGRPTVPLSSRDLLEIVLESPNDTHLIPAHAWTPWFSTLGSKGGYDSIEACFRDLSSQLFAIETGLSSDPAMNWRWSQLDQLTMLSSSDAHSPQKLGREANLFNTELSYKALFAAIKTGKGFWGTYEFFPEEGKYSYDGHRKCGVSLAPAQTMQLNGICPHCHKPLTIGVMNRVEKLADRAAPQQPLRAPGFHYIIPLPEILSEIHKASPDSKKVTQAYIEAVSAFGNEFNLLKEAPVSTIRHFNPRLGEAIHRMREGNVKRIAGYDGVYGKITLFEQEEWTGKKQLDLFA